MTHLWSTDVLPFRVRSVRLAIALLLVAVGVAIHVTPEQADAAPDDYTVTYPEWGVTEISGPFRSVLRIPGQPLAVVELELNDGTNRFRLGMLNTDTYDVAEGPSLDTWVEEMVVSSDGSWLYTTSSETGDDVLAEVVRYALPSMTLDQRFAVDLREEWYDLYDAIEFMAPVPGAPTRLVVITTSGQLALYDNGVLVGSPADGGFYGAEVVMVDATTGFVGDGSSLHRLAITPTGATVGPDVAANGGTQSDFRLHQGRLIFRSMSYPLPSLSPARPATVDEFGFADTDYRVSFVAGRTGRSGGIYDLDSGEPIIENEYARVGAYLGDGRSAFASSDALVVTNLFDTLGSYGEFHALPPARLFDTRSGLGRDGDTSMLGPRSTTRVQIHGVGGVPEFGVESVVLNITAIDLEGARSSHVKVWPAGYSEPGVSNLNFQTGSRVGNMATVATSYEGFVDLYQHAGNVHVTVDVMGWFGTWWAGPGGRYRPYVPNQLGDPDLPADRVRVVDTRPGDGSTGHAALGRQDTMRLQMPVLTGYYISPPYTDEDIPYSDVDGVVLNVAALDPTNTSHIKIFAGGDDLPEASSMNFPPGQNTARMITAPVAPDGTIDIYNHSGTTDIIVDFIGFYTARSQGQEGRFVGIEPVREIDTRGNSPFGGDGRLPAQSSIVQGGYKQSIQLAANLTIADAATRGFITAFSHSPDPIGVVSAPGWSSLNYEPGRNVANHAIIPTSGGEIEVYHHAGLSHLILDVFGYYTAYRG